MNQSIPIEFVHDHQAVALAPGAVYDRAGSLAFADIANGDLQAIVQAVEGGQRWREVIDHRFRETEPWLHQIIRSEKRTAFLDPLLPTAPGVALDIGCGWGQMTRPLAAAGWRVAALEPGRERLQFVIASTRQDQIDDRVSFIATDYLDTAFTTRFDACLCIGVFEWIGAFQEHADPLQRQRVFLRKVRDELAPGGALIIGIENRLGLKYLLGCPDDHIGVPGIAFLPAELAARRWREATKHALRSFTYSEAELRALLDQAGFSQIEFFAALPDYKLPEAIIPLADGGTEFNRRASSGEFPPEHNGYNGERLPIEQQENLQATYASLAMQGIAHHFTPSFFVRAR